MLPLDLGDGLTLRRATVRDAEALIAFNADVHREPGAAAPDRGIETWTRDFFERPHPTVRIEDFLVVEEVARGAIVSSLNLIPQTWSIGGVRFGVGRIELVGTHPDYRRRGLIRRQFEVVHRWCAERDLPVQGITGIPWFYRQFGYEMTLALAGGRRGFVAHIPQLGPDEADPYQVRPATEADLSFVDRVYDAARSRSLVWCERDAAIWRHELQGRREPSAEHSRIAVVERRVLDGRAAAPVGAVVHIARLWGPSLGVRLFELEPGAAYLEATPTVLRYLARVGEEYARRDGGQFDRYYCALGEDHPAYHAAPDAFPVAARPYAWYIRVADLPAFVRRLAPVLDDRLAASPAAGYTGVLDLDFYRAAVRLTFQRGRLTGSEPLASGATGPVRARLPDLTVLHLLFGHRSLAELEHAHADCLVSEGPARTLLEALFPKAISRVWPLG